MFYGIVSDCLCLKRYSLSLLIYLQPAQNNLALLVKNILVNFTPEQL